MPVVRNAWAVQNNAFIEQDLRQSEEYETKKSVYDHYKTTCELNQSLDYI